MNLGDDEFKYKSRVFEIAPNTKRNQELRAKKLAEENQRKQEAEKVPYIISNIFLIFSIIWYHILSPCIKII